MTNVERHTIRALMVEHKPLNPWYILQWIEVAARLRPVNATASAHDMLGGILFMYLYKR